MRQRPLQDDGQIARHPNPCEHLNARQLDGHAGTADASDWLAMDQGSPVAGAAHPPMPSQLETDQAAY